MAETSQFFTAVTGSPSYNGSDFAAWMYNRLFRKDGVLKGLDNALAVTFDGSGNALVATGCATKNGYGYQNSAVLTKALTLPTAGFTNINTVIIRVDGTASPNLVHAVVLVGTSVAIGGTPTAPALTAGSDIYLADIQCTNTAGTYSYVATDRRVYAATIVHDTDLGTGWFSTLITAIGTGWAAALAAGSSAFNATTASTSLYGINFDYIVDSDAKFLAWQGMTSGCEKVLIRKGTWTLASGGILLSTTGTKVVVGESGSQLVFSNATSGLYYSSVPTTLDYYINNVSLSSSGTGASFGFYNCNNLTECIAISTGGGSGIGNGFYHCTNLINCNGTGSGSGFYDCTNLINCNGTGTGAGVGAGSGGGMGFSVCNKLMICNGTASGSGSGSGWGFYCCNDLMNCNGSGTGSGATGAGRGFDSCNSVTACAGVGTSAGVGVGYGFLNCKKMQQNKPNGASKTATYSVSYADSGTANLCADTAAGGYNS